MNPRKALRKFGEACLKAPPGARLTVGVAWLGARKGWRVLMQVHLSALMLGADDARGLAAIYDKHHRSPEYRGVATGLEWIAPELRNLADEIEQKNRDKIVPPGAVAHMQPAGTA